jgi:hypothetical protein
MPIKNPNPNRGFGSEIVADTVSGLDTVNYRPPFYEGLVVDIILNEEHPEYTTNGFNIGRALIRPLNNGLKNTEADDDTLDWCDPLDMRFTEYPIKGEMVLIWKIAEIPFYTRPLPIGKKPTENAYLNLNKSLKGPEGNANPEASNSNNTGEHSFGEYFKPLRNSHHLRAFEGDVIIHGRFGNTVRFGSSQISPDEEGLNPNILIRVGEPSNIKKVKNVDNPQGLVYEDVNLDASSIYIVADQRIDLKPGPKAADSYLRSAADETTGEFIGSQILLNSDKITINTKRNEIFILSAEGIHGSANKNITFDTDQHFKVSTNIDTKFVIGRNLLIDAREDAIVTIGRNTMWTSKTRISAHANKIFVGSKDDDKEPMVGGTTLSKFLARLIQALAGIQSNANQPTPPVAFAPAINTNMHVITPVGPGILAPAVVAGLTKLYSELVAPNAGQDSPIPFAGAPFNSKDNFVSLDNTDPQITEIPAPMSPADKEALERYKAELLDQRALVQDPEGAVTVDEEISFVQKQLDDNELAADEVVEPPPPVNADGICQAIVAAAKTNIGLRELSLPDTINTPAKRQPFNSNTHPIIDNMFRLCGLDNVGEFRRNGTGFHWCAAAVTNWWKNAGADVPPNQIRTPQGRRISGGPSSVQHWFEWASAFGYLSETPVVGAAALYYDSKARRHNHIGVVASVNPLVTIEGNTSDPSGGFNRNGIGCFEKKPKTGGSRRIIYVLPVQGGKITACALRQLGRTE